MATSGSALRVQCPHVVKNSLVRSSPRGYMPNSLHRRHLKPDVLSNTRVRRVRALDVDVVRENGDKGDGDRGERDTPHASSSTREQHGDQRRHEVSISIESVKYENGSFHVCGTMRHPAGRQTVYETLVDYDALPRVFHNVDSCSVRRCSSGKLIVSQMVGWKFLIFRGAFETELEVVEDSSGQVLTFSLIRSAFMKEFVGDWEVVDAVGGGSLTRHELSVMPMVRPPQRIGNITAKIFETQVKCVLKDLADELSLRLDKDAGQDVGGTGE